ncbi:CDP-glycerol--glycerophosphate glycerophosphotransferase [Bacillus sp. AFS073361]|uniref:CDP-glycerol glycerophosphotransferase family protein n=1 Tax=Bacillus sp. AFS073361 TaxID=2033511 RepID=UPI000BF857F4|nr:CDP-glycerol glycerophosphotransferase family protein [Bacillus sp. AFS073361]PFP23280.1 CDP-glycerol--glycerophosphate glycerophosphotransferase [Bacillus sp. AFS073361]
MNKKILKRRIKFIFGPLYNYVRKANHRRNFQYRRFYEKSKVRDHTILYESRDGKSVTDSPYAIFKYLLHHPEFQHFKHIWSIHHVKELESVIANYKDLKNVIFVKRNSKEYLKWLATSKYLINNSTFQPFFIPKKEQVYINTWHGTPLKRMGFDIPGNPAHSQNVVRNFLSADYLLSPNDHTTKMFLNSYKLNGLYNGEIIQEGYPRIDLTYHTDADRFHSLLTRLGLEIDKNKQTILYAPTWKGTNVSKAKNDMFQIISEMTYLRQKVGNEYNLLIKVHPFLYNQAKKFTEIKEILVPDFVDTNELLSTVDLLITDYSSIFFDYLVTGKPILFYIWDYDDYQEERGMYLSEDELPGPTLFTIEEVADAVQDINKISDSYRPVYQAAKNKFTSHDDGKVTARIVQYVFNQEKTPINIINQLDREKKKILIYPGGLQNNGITSSFINLVDNIDYSKFDVSIFMKSPKSKESLNNIAKVNKNARFLFRNGLEVHSLFEVYRDKFVHNRGAHSKVTKKLYPENAYKREYNRISGRAQFDYAIDFSGYSLYWAKYLLASDAKKKICYMHNDIRSDSEKVINGRRPHRINLRGLFSVYDRFDKLVSVSPATMELNRSNLAEFAEEFKFDFVMNSINPEKILRLGNEEWTESITKSIINEVIAEDQIISNTVFKASARITNPKNEVIWNRPPVVSGAAEVAPALKYLNEEVAILREVQTKSTNYYKFSIDDRIVGWLDQGCFELLPDRVLLHTPVQKLAIISHGNRYDIWSMPYNLEGTEKVASGKDYKGRLVDVDEEARTQQGIYSRLSIKGTMIGWIDSSALTIVREYDGRKQLHSKIHPPLYKMLHSKKYKLVVPTIIEEKLETIEETVIPPQPVAENYNFITMGRLSPEKGQDNLIKAFSQFQQKFPNSKLYILGEGPLRNDLENLIAELELSDSVYLMGQLENPFILMKKCDCFVLSSHYEGQPMVLLEAMTHGMKIIATDIVANRNVLENGRYGLLVENSIEGLEKGLTQLAGNELDIKLDEFIPEEYNKKAMASFYQILD